MSPSPGRDRGGAIPGREQRALRALDEATRYDGRLRQAGEITGFDVFSLEPHGDDLVGFVLLRRDRGAPPGGAPARTSSASTGGRG